MESVAYGLFQNRTAADAALARLDRRGLPDDVVRVSEHVGEIADEDITGAASRTRPGAVIGGLFAAVLGGILGALVFGGRVGLSPLYAGAIGALGAGLFGALLGTITGTAVPRKEISDLDGAVADGKVLVTIDSESEQTTQDLIAQLERYGAIRTGLMSGMGLQASAAGGGSGS